MGKFTLRTNEILEKFFAQEPFKEYKSYFNIYQLITPSKESGASHKPELIRDTALGTYYNCGGIQRAICGDDDKIDAILKNTKLSDGTPLIKADIFIALVNDPQHGGTGGHIAFSSAESRDAAETFLHEVSHSFGKLADEYDYGDCDSSRHSKANTSPPTDPSNVKWAHWVGEDFDNGEGVKGKIGMFEGANYCTKGLYRPSENSKMKQLGPNFDQITREELVKRIYRAVSHFENAVPRPPQGQKLNLGGNKNLTFQVMVQKPATHSLEVSWAVDGKAREGTERAGWNEMVVNFETFSAGPHKVVVTSKDPSPWVRKDPNSRMTESKTWIINKNEDGSFTMEFEVPPEINCQDLYFVKWGGNACEGYRDKGYCASVPDYMNKYCRRSCRTCNLPEEPAAGK